MSKKHRDQFERRLSGFQIPKDEIDRMYQREMEYQLHLQWMSEQALTDAQGTVAFSPAGGGNGESASLPASLPCLEMVVNTEDELTFEFRVYTSSSAELTIDWGDGNEQVENLGTGSFSIDHTYSLGQDYNVQVCFDNPDVITRLRFDGSGNSFSVLKSITGLQAFSNLSRFDADDNALQSVDLSGLSNLTYAEIGDNVIVGTSTPSLTSVNLSGCVALEELRLDDSDFSAGIPDLSGLDSLKFIDVDESLISGSVDISFLPALEDFDFSINPGLTELIISSSQPLGFNNEYLNANYCGLTQTSVDAILVALSQNGISGGQIGLQGGTNATPGAAGLAAKSVLEGNSWSVDVN